jgi:ADP-heptose:LPS heptosyltransferase
MARILIVRFSALGDVAMTVPVVHSLAAQYPQHEFVVLSRPNCEPLFGKLPANVTFFGAHLSGRHQGLLGLGQLYSELSAIGFDYVADLHDVLRTKYLRLRFMLAGVKCAHIDKGRKEKRELVRREGKKLVSLKSSFRRYADVFERLGLPVQVNFSSLYGDGKGDFSTIENIVGEPKTQGMKWIGIAPFAKHQGKIYPLALQERVVEHFSNRPDVRVFLFGGGAEEKAILDGWSEKYAGATCMIGKLTMAMELTLISHLDVMLTMDSANMHMASLVNTTVVSVWGATHPYAGFLGWKQLPTNAVQLDMPCRPCSVYGQKPCLRGDYACMNNISPEQIIEKIEGCLTD